MKKLISPIVLLISVALISTLSYSQDTDSVYSDEIDMENTVILPFLNALKNGDVKKIKNYLSTDTYNEYKKLLEENKEYPKFLRDYYKDAKFRVVRASSEVEGEVEFEVFVEFQNGSEIVNQYKVVKETNLDGAIREQRKWRITKASSNKE